MSRSLRSVRPLRRAALVFLAAATAIVSLAGHEIQAQGRFGKNKVHYRSFDWHVYNAPHFDVYYYPDSEPFLEQMVSYAESAYLYLSRELDHEPKFRIPLIYYRTHGEFEQTNISLSEIPEYVGAFAEPLQHRMVLPIDIPPDKLYKLVVHELTHIFEFSILFQDSLGRAVRGGAPSWLMEGLSSHMADDEDNLDIMVIRDAVIHGLVPPISRIQGLSFLTYRFGQAAFDFIESEWGQEGLRSFLNEYRRVLLYRNIEKAIKEAFGMEADEFDRRFQKYLRRKYLPALLEKDEPADYGKEIGIKMPGVMTFSPVLSPSGDLVAVLTTRFADLDVVIISAKDGEVIKNITKGFTNEYEFISTAAFEGKSDLAWSPDGDLVAFFVRKEGTRVLMVKNALSGHRVKTMEVQVANAASPAFSPDGEKIVFSGNRNGVVDIFEIDYVSGEVRNLTDDEFYDSNPSWSADGQSILYNRRVDAYEKIFLMDYEDPSRRTQITFGPVSELMPSFTRDGKRILYSSDAGDEGIFNLHSLDLDTGAVNQYTDVMAGFFQAQDRPAEHGKDRVVTTTYFKGRFRLFEVDVSKPLKVVSPEERAGQLGELEPFEPPLRLTVDDEEKQPFFKRTYHVETAPTVGVGVANDGTIFGNAALIFSDLLGDHRFWAYITSVADFQNVDLGYVSLGSRLQYHYRARDFRDFILVPTGGNNVSRVDSSRVTGVEAGLTFPLNRYYRLETNVGAFNRDTLNSELVTLSEAVEETFNLPGAVNEDETAFLLLGLDNIKSTNAVFSGNLVGDTVRYNPWGPWHGKRFNLGVSRSPFGTGDDDSTFTNYSLDFRAYGKVTRRSLFAFRLGSFISRGGGSTLFGIGGYNQLRGYQFREFIGDQAAWANLEFRFPLVDELRFPFGSIRWIRGLFFFDVGTAWTQDGNFFDSEYGQMRTRLPDPADPNKEILVGIAVPGVFRDFKFWDSEENTLRDGRASYGLGFSFRMGILDLTWTFAKTLPYMQTDRQSCQREIITVFDDLGANPPQATTDDLISAMGTCEFERVSGSNWRSDFYIGTAF
jgi:hypothetical protein